ncbi:MAG: hypothetical protein OXB84_02490 [Halobacteriovoraceae bacterium]|nr:hypothetical protein [Halobacteriovoraceae bacterium]
MRSVIFMICVMPGLLFAQEQLSLNQKILIDAQHDFLPFPLNAMARQNNCLSENADLEWIQDQQITEVQLMNEIHTDNNEEVEGVKSEDLMEFRPYNSMIAAKLFFSCQQYNYQFNEFSELQYQNDDIEGDGFQERYNKIQVYKEFTSKQFISNSFSDQIAEIELVNGRWISRDEILEILNYFYQTYQLHISLPWDKIVSIQLENGEVLSREEFWEIQNSNPDANPVSFLPLYKQYHQLDDSAFFNHLEHHDGTRGGGGGGR